MDLCKRDHYHLLSCERSIAAFFDLKTALSPRLSYAPTFQLIPQFLPNSLVQASNSLDFTEIERIQHKALSEGVVEPGQFYASKVQQAHYQRQIRDYDLFSFQHLYFRALSIQKGEQRRFLPQLDSIELLQEPCAASLLRVCGQSASILWKSDRDRTPLPQGKPMSRKAAKPLALGACDSLI